ncbi:MAG: alpha/beta hydrolase [Vicinamibacteria bacterium]|nr:alpha/beta hydrolase [Vicinamibacteria bacterium]
MRTKRPTPLVLLTLLALPAQSFAQDPQRISLWPNGAPGSQARRAEPEQAQDYWVKNIHDPSITVYMPPREKATGAGVVVIPGGGHRLLVYKAEGVEPAQFLNSLGVAAFVLKHRLQREEGSTYTIERDAKADAYRAMRTVRSRAAEFGVDPKQLGVMGFSAGGEVVGLISFGSGAGDQQAPDPIDRINGRPDFAIFIYPGPLAVQATVPATAPPAFLAAASDDPCCSIPTLKILQQYKDAGVPVEAHVFAKGGHGFNMGQRSKLKAVNTWPQRLADWLSDSGLLGK